jgi:putative sterol carrier protein
MALFGTEEWVDLLKVEVSKDKELPKAGKGFDAAIQFVVKSAGKRGELAFWAHMKDGKILEAAANDVNKKAEYVITGDYSVWQDIVAGKQDPIQAIMLKKLVFEGNIQMVMKYIKAVNLIMESVKRIPTDF